MKILKSQYATQKQNILEQILDPQQFGQRLREARERQGISQDDLANLVSKDQRAISEYERGVRKIAAIDLPDFARVLNVSILFFFDAEMNPEDLDQAFLAEFSRLPERAKRGAIQILRILDEISDS